MVFVTREHPIVKEYLAAQQSDNEERIASALAAFENLVDEQKRKLENELIILERETKEKSVCVKKNSINYRELIDGYRRAVRVVEEFRALKKLVRESKRRC